MAPLIYCGPVWPYRHRPPSRRKAKITECFNLPNKNIFEAGSHTFATNFTSRNMFCSQRTASAQQFQFYCAYTFLQNLKKFHPLRFANLQVQFACLFIIIMNKIRIAGISKSLAAARPPACPKDACRRFPCAARPLPGRPSLTWPIIAASWPYSLARMAKSAFWARFSGTMQISLPSLAR